MPAGRKPNPKYLDYEFANRKTTLMMLECGVKQFLYEANKLRPMANKFESLNDDEQRRYLEAVMAIKDWSHEMHQRSGDILPYKEYDIITEI